jgi:hypothetical protein
MQHPNAFKDDPRMATALEPNDVPLRRNLDFFRGVFQSSASVANDASTAHHTLARCHNHRRLRVSRY